MKINESKMKLAQKELRFFGHILTGDGVKIDPDKTAAIWINSNGFPNMK
jgi:hypothetical protein